MDADKDHILADIGLVEDDQRVVLSSVVIKVPASRRVLDHEEGVVLVLDGEGEPETSCPLPFDHNIRPHINETVALVARESFGFDTTIPKGRAAAA